LVSNEKNTVAFNDSVCFSSMDSYRTLNLPSCGSSCFFVRFVRYLSECSPRGALLVLQVTRFLLAVTTNSFIREMAQGRSRSVDVLRTPRKQKPRQMKTEPVNVLKESAAILAQRCRIPRPWLLDPRGNAFAASSTGHIHHPFNLERVAYRWATLTESLLDSTQFGMRTELPTGFYANRYIANSSAKKS